MKRQLGFLAVLLLFLSLLGWVGHARAQKNNNDRKVWEYKVGATSLMGTPSVQDQLNQLGAEGWELVAVDNVSTLTPPSAVYYLKRVKE